MSELIVIPKEVLFAQAELMSAGMVELGDVLGINVPDSELGSSYCPRGRNSSR